MVFTHCANFLSPGAKWSALSFVILNSRLFTNGGDILSRHTHNYYSEPTFRTNYLENEPKSLFDAQRAFVDGFAPSCRLVYTIEGYRCVSYYKPREKTGPPWEVIPLRSLVTRRHSKTDCTHANLRLHMVNTLEGEAFNTQYSRLRTTLGSTTNGHCLLLRWHPVKPIGLNESRSQTLADV